MEIFRVRSLAVSRSSATSSRASYLAQWTIYIGLPVFAMWISNIPETAEFFKKVDFIVEGAVSTAHFAHWSSIFRPEALDEYDGRACQARSKGGDDARFY